MAKVRSFFKTNKLSVAEKQKMIKFCKTFRYETYKRMKCFIKQGRKSSGKMYIIINGKVGVYTKKINKLSQCRRGQPMPFSKPASPHKEAILLLQYHISTYNQAASSRALGKRDSPMAGTGGIWTFLGGLD